MTNSQSNDVNAEPEQSQQDLDQLAERNRRIRPWRMVLNVGIGVAVLSILVRLVIRLAVWLLGLELHDHPLLENVDNGSILLGHPFSFLCFLIVLPFYLFARKLQSCPRCDSLLQLVHDYCRKCDLGRPGKNPRDEGTPIDP